MRRFVSTHLGVPLGPVSRQPDRGGGPPSCFPDYSLVYLRNRRAVSRAYSALGIAGQRSPIGVSRRQSLFSRTVLASGAPPTWDVVGRISRRGYFDVWLNPQKLFHPFVSLFSEIVLHLKPKPEVRRGAKVTRKPHGGIGCDAALPVQNLTYSCRRNMSVFCQTVGRDGHRLEKLFQKDLSWMNIG